MNTPRSLLLVALALVTIVLVAHARIAIGGRTWDDTPYHVDLAPARLAAAGAVQAGQAPAWWDGTGLGVPLLGEPGHGASYPAHWLAATPLALDLILIVHLAWAALGVALWARRLGASEIAAVAAGALIATSGVMASAALRGALPALAHLPWIAWAAASARHVALGLLIGAVGLAGELAVLAHAIALASVIGADQPAPRAWIERAVAIAAGIAIACVQWIPAALALSHVAGADVHALSPARWLELIVPARTADPGAWFPALHVGAPLIAFAAIARPGRPRVAFAASLVALAALAGRGGWPAWAGAPELHLAALALVAAPYAAVGLDRLLAGARRAWIALAACAVLAALALASRMTVDRVFLDGAIAAAGAAGALALAWRRPAAPRASLAIVVLVVAPSVGALPSLAPTLDRAVVADRPAWASAAIPPEALGAPRRVYRPVYLFGDAQVRAGELPREALEDAIATLAGASAARWGIAAARSADPARPAAHDRVWRAAAGDGGALLDRFGIALAILPGSIAESGSVGELARRGGWSLIGFPASPPAAVVHEWVWARDSEAALARLFPPGVRGLGAGVLVLHGAGSENQDEPGRPVPCRIERWLDGAIDLACEAREPAYAVVASTPAPGWSVAVDGAPVSWQVADVLRRAVAIPAGVHRVSWRYAAPGLAARVACAAIGLVALGALAGRAIIRRRRTRDRASRATN